MNNIHEQCPNSDSETELSPKTGSKLSQVHKAPNLAHPAHTGAPKRARACRVVAECRAQLNRVAGLAAVSWPSIVPCCDTRPAAWLPCLSQYTPVYYDTNPCLLQPSSSACHDTIYCIVTPFPHPTCRPYHNTIFVL